MAELNFPDSPALNELFVDINGTIWKWDSQMWRRQGVGPQTLVQSVNVQDGAVATGTPAAWGYDDTIPQQTEGMEVLTRTITPTNATNLLIITAQVNGSHSTQTYMQIALFKDAIADALSVTSDPNHNGTWLSHLNIHHQIVAGGIAEQTFKIRLGPGGGSGGTTTVNGTTGSRLFGGTFISSLTVQEITP